jgi:uncharacterized membrane protein YhdT
MVDDTDDAAMVTATGEATPRAAPWHLWAVGGVSLLWNAFGATDYTMSQTRNRDYLGSAAESMGITADQMIAYIDAFPGWMHAFWALGVWGALIGSVLLLLRKRQAVWAFGLSLLGLAVTQFYQAFTPQPEWAEGAVVMNLVIWSIATFLVIYAVSMKNKGVLR